MFIFRNLRAGTGLLALATLMLLFSLHLGGCSDGETSPTAVTLNEPPVLPVAEQLAFDFSFFEAAPGLDKAAGTYDNFINAYLRTALLDVMARLVLVAPVGAFSAAVHTVPVAQADGSWLWSYDWRYGTDQVGIRLRGLPLGDVVNWELSLVPAGTTAGVPWFSGTTNGDGREGHWEFRDLETAGYPVSGEINWGASQGGTYLEFLSREDGSDGARLRFADDNPDFRITFTSDSGAADSFIQWHASGQGSLRVPDFNGGLEACWGVDLRNIDCQ